MTRGRDTFYCRNAWNRLQINIFFCFISRFTVKIVLEGNNTKCHTHQIAIAYNVPALHFLFNVSENINFIYTLVIKFKVGMK